MPAPDIQSLGHADQNGRVFSHQRLPRFTPGRTGPQIGSARDMNRLVDELNVLLSLQANPPSAGSISISDSNAVLDLQGTQDQIDTLTNEVEILIGAVRLLWTSVFGTTPPI